MKVVLIAGGTSGIGFGVASMIPVGSRILFTGSQMAVHPHAMVLSYGVTKSAVCALAKNLVKEFEDTGTT